MPETLDDFEALAGRLLIATQSDADQLFYKTLVLVTEHSAEAGTVGYVLNKPFLSLSPKEIFKDRDISFLGADFQLMWGGPVDLTHGAVLHTNDYQTAGTQILKNNLALTETQQILDDITTQTGPKHFLICVGKTTWAPGQLIEEIMDSMWVPIPYSFDLTFNTPVNKKWQEALATLNIDSNLLAHKAGKA